MRFKGSPDPAMLSPGSEKEKGHAFELPRRRRYHALALTVPNEAAAEQRFAALSDGGQIQMPVAESFFSPRSGMVVDRFGVTWMVLVEPRQPRARSPAGCDVSHQP
jgi:PhnB protein